MTYFPLQNTLSCFDGIKHFWIYSPCHVWFMYFTAQHNVSWQHFLSLEMWCYRSTMTIWHFRLSVCPICCRVRRKMNVCHHYVEHMPSASSFSPVIRVSSPQRWFCGRIVLSHCMWPLRLGCTHWSCRLSPQCAVTPSFWVSTALPSVDTAIPVGCDLWTWTALPQNHGIQCQV